VHRALGSLLFLALALPAIGAQPENSDTHLSGETAKNLYAASAFAHGLRHGYEEGFHEADRDLQLSAFSVEDIPVKKPGKIIGYQASFGPKESFRKGYEAGYRLGYADSLKGITFRMNPPAVDVAAVPDKDFDHGVQYGYAAPGTACSGAPNFCAGVKAGRAIAEESQNATQVASAR
jgi:hypothetical protein